VASLTYLLASLDGLLGGSFLRRKFLAAEVELTETKAVTFFSAAAFGENTVLGDWLGGLSQ
jgi:hypothetical protein